MHNAPQSPTVTPGRVGTRPQQDDAATRLLAGLTRAEQRELVMWSRMCQEER